MGNLSHNKLIESDPKKMGGTPVFRGTRVPIKNLFDYLEGGDSMEVFLDNFPIVEREQAVALMAIPKNELPN